MTKTRASVSSPPLTHGWSSISSAGTPRPQPARDRASIVVRRSTIHALGCFTPRAIDSGAFIAEYRGEVIGEAEAWHRDDPRSAAYSPYVMHLAGEWFIDGAIRGNDLRYLNHSCEPNCRVVRTRERVFIIADRRIGHSEELTIDYALDGGLDFVCRCRASLCRGVPLSGTRDDS